MEVVDCYPIEIPGTICCSDLFQKMKCTQFLCEQVRNSFFKMLHDRFWTRPNSLKPTYSSSPFRNVQSHVYHVDKLKLRPILFWIVRKKAALQSELGRRRKNKKKTLNYSDSRWYKWYTYWFFLYVGLLGTQCDFRIAIEKRHYKANRWTGSVQVLWYRANGLCETAL